MWRYTRRYTPLQRAVHSHENVTAHEPRQVRESPKGARTYDVRTRQQLHFPWHEPISPKAQETPFVRSSLSVA
eukprot:7281326-Prymnesium_polylepis.2